MKMYLRLISESFKFAMNALRTNKLRTLLSLLGVTIGIFSIIAVLAAVDSLDKKIKKDLSSLDKNMVYLFKGSFGPSEIPRWKRDQFPEVKYDEYLFLKNNMPNVAEMAFQLFVRPETVKNDQKSISDVSIVPVSYEYIDIQALEFDAGRFYNEVESNRGAAVAVIGSEIATSLFANVDPIGKTIRLYGQQFNVIGVLKKQGEGTFGGSDDASVFLPVNFVRRMYGDNNKSMTKVIVIKPTKNVDMDEFRAVLSQKLRTMRGLKISEIDNFFINVFSGFTDLIDGFIGSLNVGGWVIAGFSLLVGGFGVANIMFVSVKERTNLIGIQKSLGAKNRFILFQFLFEAIILCLIGGIIGILMVWGIAALLSSLLDFEFILSFKNICLGTGLAMVIGLISGILPAISASKLDPVEAIRSGI